MIKHEISPVLRQLGLKGSGGRYELPSATHWALVGFQKSSYSDAVEVRFTVNLCAIDRQTWETMREERPHIGARPTPSTLYGTRAAQPRIGDLLPDGQGDKWWRVTQGEPTASVAADVLNDLTRFGLPWLRHNVTDLGH